MMLIISSFIVNQVDAFSLVPSTNARLTTSKIFSLDPSRELTPIGSNDATTSSSSAREGGGSSITSSGSAAGAYSTDGLTEPARVRQRLPRTRGTPLPSQQQNQQQQQQQQQQNQIPNLNQLPPSSRLGPMVNDDSNSDLSYRKSTQYFSQFFGRTTVDPSFGAEGTILKPMPMYPSDVKFDRIEGVKTVRNYRIPYGCERVQYILHTPTGRPLKATVELWVGPIRKVHTLEIKSEKAPVRATLKFKKGIEVITIRTGDDGELPVSACVIIPTEDRADALNKNTELMWKNNPKTKIQGGCIQGGKTKTVGAIRYFHIPYGATAVQCIIWSKDVGKKSFKLKIEILQGPNNIKQSYELQCGGGSQPYHTIYELSNDSLPGEDGSVGGGVIRMINKKFLEDGLVQVVVVPIFPEGSGLSGDVQVY